LLLRIYLGSMFVSATQKRLTWIGDPLTLYNHDFVFIYLFTYLLIAENQHLDDDDDDVPYLAGKEVFIAQRDSSMDLHFLL